MTSYGRIFGIVFLLGLLLQSQVRGQSLVERLEKRLQQAVGDRTTAPPRGGEPTIAESQPGSLGLTVSDESDDGGLRVVSVREGSPAEQAGFHVDDVITAIGGQQIRETQDMANALSRMSTGGRTRFDIVRDGDPKPLTVVMPAIPNFPDFPSGPKGVAVVERPSLGITVAPVTEESRTRQGVPVRKGATISAVKSGGAASKYGLPIGGVIVAFDGRKIDTPQELIDAVRASEVGQEVELHYYQGPNLNRKRVRIAPDLEPVTPDLNRPRATPTPGSRLRDTLGTDLPAVRRLEGFLDRALPADRPTPSSLVDELHALRQEVETLRRQVEELTRRVDELPKP